MKGSAAALAALLLLALCSPAVDSLPMGHPDEDLTYCCFTYQQRRVPRGLIADAYTTSSSCPQPGVVLVTKKGKQICTDPQKRWVQKLLEHIQSQEN